MSKENWLSLYDIFEKEDLGKKYEDMYKVLSLIVESIKLADKQEEINKELQEINKNEN